jgi:glucose-1-phosphate thymidylyltransferase
VDLIKHYQKKRRLNHIKLGRGAIWSDAGKIDDFMNISNFVTSVEKVQGLKIACLDEIAYKKNWIKKDQLIKNINFYGNCPYSDYLKKILKK